MWFCDHWQMQLEKKRVEIVPCWSLHESPSAGQGWPNILLLASSPVMRALTTLWPKDQTAVYTVEEPAVFKKEHTSSQENNREQAVAFLWHSFGCVPWVHHWAPAYCSHWELLWHSEESEGDLFVLSNLTMAQWLLGSSKHGSKPIQHAHKLYYEVVLFFW